MCSDVLRGIINAKEMAFIFFVARNFGDILVFAVSDGLAIIVLKVMYKRYTMCLALIR